MCVHVTGTHDVSIHLLSLSPGPATALSLEEQRIEHSIVQLNQRLRGEGSSMSQQLPQYMVSIPLPDHSRRDPRCPDFDPPASYPVHPHTPPIKQSPHPPSRHPPHPPNSVRSRGPGDLPKTRVRRDPRTVAMAATLHAQALDSRSQTGTTVRRQFQNS